MASTYTPIELRDSGSFLKEDFNAGNSYQIDVYPSNPTDPNIYYLFLHTRTYADPALPLYFSGSTCTVIQSGSGVVIEDYKMGMNCDPDFNGGNVTSSFLWTPQVDVVGSNVYISATGTPTCEIDLIL